VARFIQWVKMYRYLGFDVTLDLQLHEYVARRVQTLNVLHSRTRFLQYNRVKDGLGVCTQLQLLSPQMLLTVKVDVLLTVLPVAPDTAMQIDTAVRGTARKILGPPANRRVRWLISRWGTSPSQPLCSPTTLACTTIQSTTHAASLAGQPQRETGPAAARSAINAHWPQANAGGVCALCSPRRTC
jgi:hypothetical protein